MEMQKNRGCRPIPAAANCSCGKPEFAAFSTSTRTLPRNEFWKSFRLPAIREATVMSAPTSLRFDRENVSHSQSDLKRIPVLRLRLTTRSIPSTLRLKVDAASICSAISSAIHVDSICDLSKVRICRQRCGNMSERLNISAERQQRVCMTI